MYVFPTLKYLLDSNRQNIFTVIRREIEVETLEKGLTCRTSSKGILSEISFDKEYTTMPMTIEN